MVNAPAVVRWAAALKVAGLHVAELFDAFRLFPRLFCTGYGYLCWEMWKWFATRPDVSAAQGAIVASVIGLCIPLLGLYFNSGRKWGEAPNVTVNFDPTKKEEA